MRGLILSCMVITLIATSAAEELDILPGLERTLAQTRKGQLTDISYDLRLSFPASPMTPFKGQIDISFVLKRTVDPLILDFKETSPEIRDFSVDGKLSEFSLKNQHLIVHGPLSPGFHSIRLTYISTAASIKREPEFLYSLFVPDRASQAFPCFDQPDLKAKFSIQLEIPSEWQAVSNEKIAESQTDGRRTTHRFETTPMISTYLFAFAAGRFRTAKRLVDDREINLFFRENDNDKVSRNLDPIFEIHGQALKTLASYTATPYPFAKLDVILLPAFEFNGMEHPGAIFYRESGLLLDQTASQTQLLARANVIAHEVSHMWFGDLVTMKWFDDVWLKEVMANFLAAKVTEPIFAKFNHRLKFYLSLYPGAYDIDRTEGTHPIRQELGNLQQAGSVYGGIIYLKAPILMRQLEQLLGVKAFRDSLREYLRIYRFSNATWNDLVQIFEKHYLGRDSLKSWSDMWIDQSGRPEIAILRKGSSIFVEPSDPTKHTRVWPQVFSLSKIGGDGSLAPVQVHIKHRTRTQLRVDPDTPILGNSMGTGYGFFRLESKTKMYLLQHLSNIRDPVARAVAWSSLWDEFYSGSIVPFEIAELAYTSASKESDDLILESLLNRFSLFYWKFLRPEERLLEGRRWENWLWGRLSQESVHRLKPVFWSTFLSLAQSEEALIHLKQIWSGEIHIPGLSLSESDHMNLALELALRLPGESNDILNISSKRIKNPDLKSEFEFLRPALSSRDDVRREFFFSFKSASNRKREPWVARAINYIGHPMRQDIEFLIEPGLQWLEEIQKGGDIFFPLVWCQAILRGQQSASAAAKVRKFLLNHPDYPLDLKNKVLQAADFLFRSAKLDNAKTDTKQY